MNARRPTTGPSPAQLPGLRALPAARRCPPTAAAHRPAAAWPPAATLTDRPPPAGPGHLPPTDAHLRSKKSKGFRDTKNIDIAKQQNTQQCNHIHAPWAALCMFVCAYFEYVYLCCCCCPRVLLVFPHICLHDM